MAWERLRCVEAEMTNKEALCISYEVDATRDIGMESLSLLVKPWKPMGERRLGKGKRHGEKPRG